MIKIKPANIFEFIAPTGGATKIADFKGSPAPTISMESNPIASGTYHIDSAPNGAGEYVLTAKKMNWTNWIVGGIVVLGLTGALVWYYSEEQKKKRRREEE